MLAVSPHFFHQSFQKSAADRAKLAGSQKAVANCKGADSDRPVAGFGIMCDHIVICKGCEQAMDSRRCKAGFISKLREG
jgi:hypothetical protein